MKWIKRNYGQCPYQIEINQLILMQSVRKDKMKPFDHHKILSESIKSSACNFTKINTPPWVFFTFFKLYKCYQIAQRITYLLYWYVSHYLKNFYPVLPQSPFLWKKNNKFTTCPLILSNLPFWTTQFCWGD